MPTITDQPTATAQKCYHCGDALKSAPLKYDEKEFCCNGCQTVYSLLHENDLCDYYALSSHPGISPKQIDKSRFGFLDEAEVIDKLLSFKSENSALITLYLPQIHCSSCLWLLENLYTLNTGIIESRVNFLERQITLRYHPSSVSLRQVVELLTALGYEPVLNLDQMNKPKKPKVASSLLFKLGIAGFSFGNIMLLSFPEYFGFDTRSMETFGNFFGLLNLVLATPVFAYSAIDYYKSAWVGLKHRHYNIDIPIALGIIVLFVRSAYEVLSHTGLGYFDSLTGLVFFMLLGKVFQQKTYNAMSFDRDFRSYFPISVTKLSNSEPVSTSVEHIKPGDRLLIKNEELIPVDAILKSAHAVIDNSFITGEAQSIRHRENDKLYAGSKNKGAAIEIEVTKALNQSYLTQLWNNEVFNKGTQTGFVSLTDKMSHYFTPLILAIALISGLYWLKAGLGSATMVVTAVLIVACPCALALSAPFTFGNALRILGLKGFFLKNGHGLEKLAQVQHIVFDKTGTITHANQGEIQFQGVPLSEQEEHLVYSVIANSNHPLSAMLANLLRKDRILPSNGFEEIAGKGLKATVNGYEITIGSGGFVGASCSEQANQTRVYVRIDQEVKGYFEMGNKYRQELPAVVNQLSKHYQLSVLTGDNSAEKNRLTDYFGADAALHFNQSPEQKLQYIAQCQQNGKVAMIGDGLNDAGALKQSDLGISLTDNVASFSPACDAIVDAQQFHQLPQLFQYGRSAVKIIKWSFAISLAYNVVGLSFAVTGNLTPIFAAILMPVSSITVVLFTTLSTYWIGRKIA